MVETLRCTTTLETRGPAAAIVLSDDEVQAITGGPKTGPVTVTLADGRSFAGRIARMGGENLIGLNTAVRTQLGVGAGDTVQVTIAFDAGPRTVEVPDDLAAAMADAGVTAAYAALAPSHRKEYVRWITEAKKAETRAKRVAEAVERIAEGSPRR